MGFVTRRESSETLQSNVRRDDPSHNNTSRLELFASNGNNKSRDRSNVLCSHCGKTEHEKNFCWQIIGYPEWVTKRAGRERGANKGGRGSVSSGWGRGQAHMAITTSSNSSGFSGT